MTLFGIEQAEILKIKKLLDMKDITIDELIECFDDDKYKELQIKKLENLKSNVDARLEELRSGE